MRKKSFWLSYNGLGAASLIGIVMYFLLMEHREHLFQALPYLILLLCPLMHMFMHGNHGHGDHESHEHHNQDKPTSGVSNNQKSKEK